MVSRHQQAILIRAQRQVRIGNPESQAASSFTICFYGNPGDPLSRFERSGQPTIKHEQQVSWRGMAGVGDAYNSDEVG